MNPELQIKLLETVTDREYRDDRDICKPPMQWFEDGTDFHAALTKDGESIVITRVRGVEVTRIELPRTVFKFLVKQAGGSL